MKHTIYFVRHGQTDWNFAGRFQGQIDIPLNDTGRGQARRNGRALKQHLPSLDLPFLASPMLRTRETMELLRSELGLDPTDYATDERLMEISFGKFEGLTSAEIDDRHPDQAAKRNRDKFNFAPPEGESYAMVTERVRGAIEAIDSDIVIVSHGGISRAVRGILQNLSNEEVLALATPQDQVMKLIDGRVVLV